MKKHIFGFALFSFIFASFGLAFAVFFAPQPTQVTELTTPIQEVEFDDIKNKKLFTRPNPKQEIVFRVLSSQFDLDSGEFISNVHLYWNRDGEAPKQVVVKTKLFTLENNKEKIFEAIKVLTNPFGDFGAATIVVRHKLEINLSSYGRKNLYVSFDFSNDKTFNTLFGSSEDLSEISQVLFIHGENSKSRTEILR